jgi:flagellar hook-basal body complex protein FliE
MSNSIQGLGGAATDLTKSLGGSPGEKSGEFFDTLKHAMNQVGQLQAEAQNKITGLVTGEGEDVHSAMIAVEKANMAFEMMVQVRNKIISAYQEVSRMQF